MRKNENGLKFERMEASERRLLKGKTGKAAAAVLTLAMAMTLSAPAWSFTDTQAAGKASPAVTTVTGFDKTYTRTGYSLPITDTVKVAPAYGRKVQVYHYDPDAKKWVKESTYKTSDKYSAKVKITYSNFWKTRPTAKYKITMSAVKGNGSSYSGKVTSKAAVKSLGATKLTRRMTTNFDLVTADAAVVMNAKTHKLIYQKNPDKERRVASMTKLMTATLLSEKFPLNHTVEITKEAAETPWGVGLKEGDTMTVENLIYAMFLPSGNDAACASGIAVGGTTSNFASLMNARAAQLGCTDTVYENAHGLDTDGNHSTARDQALIASHVMTAPDLSTLRTAAKTKSKVIYSGKGVKYELTNTNELLGIGTFEGLKTGTTTLAGNCFCGAFTVDGQTYVSVVLASSTGSNRFADTRMLAGLTEEIVADSQQAAS